MGWSTSRIALRALALPGASVLLASDAAWACPSCFAETGAAQKVAYLGTTALLSALPLLLLGFLAARVYLGIRRGHRAGTDAPRGSLDAGDGPRGL